MEHGLGSDQNAPHVSIDMSRVLDVRPMRCLTPVFPNPPEISPITNPNPTPFVCVPPCGPFPPGIQPFYPFLVSNGSQNAQSAPQNQHSFGVGSRMPMNSFMTPTQNGSKRGSISRGSGSVPGNDGYGESFDQNNAHMSGFSVAGAKGGSSVKRKGRPRKKGPAYGDGKEIDFESVINSFVTSFRLKEFDDSKRSNGDKNITATVLLVFDLLRRKLAHLEEVKGGSPGIAKRPDLKAANLLMTKGIRTNCTKRIGHVPGIEVGDIFFFRMELCLVGLHAPSMAGIDYMSVKISADEEPVAVSIVSSGGYDDDGDNSDVLVYTGQGGVARKDGQTFDQKLERGNLALEKSLYRGNDVRVLRGIKDGLSTGKIYVYDGLYKIQESWAEKNRSGCNVFKYKLIRVPGQPQAFSLWKSIHQFRDGTVPRPSIIVPDLTSGAETQPVALVNDVDGEEGPARFTYVSTLKYLQPFAASKPSAGCRCSGGCQPGDSSCPCNDSNDGSLPYSSIGVLLTDNNSIIHECWTNCSCPKNCRNRWSQTGIKARLEVFKTKNRGWGLRSWDPIRAGAFICEFAGDIIKDTNGNFGNANDDNYIFDSNRYYEPVEPVEDSANFKKSPFPLVISAKYNGNVARFMNHSCTPNVLWKPVLRESNNDAYLHVAFFAIRHIPPMQELTYDYGVVSSENLARGKKCLCGSSKCKGYFY